MEFLKDAYLKLRQDEGQTMAEYALIVALVAVVAVAAWTLLGTNITGVVNTIAGAI
jgi:Flp pilus assembly pilin Flp